MCGIIGLTAPPGVHAADQLYSGLLTIQHRGQDAAGIATLGKRLHLYKAEGLVRDVFKPTILQTLEGSQGLAHVRYPTAGYGGAEDAQPFMTMHPFGIALAHNGQVTNFTQLREALARDARRRVNSGCDGELLMHVFADELARAVPEGQPVTFPAIQQAVKGVYTRVRGAYSVVALIAGFGMVAFRDPFGIRPLVMGRKDLPEGPATLFASESVACDLLGFELLRDVAAGEVVFVADDGATESAVIDDKPHRPCVFEHIYFARPDSMLDDISVYKTRLRLGEGLADAWRETGIPIDVVIPVPDSARPAATEMARLLNVKYREGLVKNRYVGRTFIMPGGREAALKQKHNAIQLEFQGKDVLLVDDSIVRGNTVKQLVTIARKAGARKVYFVSCASPLTNPCVYGIDMATTADFIAKDRTPAQVAELVGADYVLYLPLDAMLAAAAEGNPSITGFCHACFSGEYPTGDVTPEILADFEQDRTIAKTKKPTSSEQPNGSSCGAWF